jgi:hypothetical protein
MWDIHSIAEVAAGIPAPDGISISNSISNSYGFSTRVSQSVSYIASDDSTYTFSVYVKNSGIPVDVTLQLSSTGITPSSNSVTYTVDSDDWVRLEIILPASADISGFDMSFHGNGDSFYVWSGQLEDLPFASSRIPTGTIAVTRPTDLCYVDFNGNGPAFDAGDTFTILADVQLKQVTDFDGILDALQGWTGPIKCGNGAFINQIVFDMGTPSGMTKQDNFLAAVSGKFRYQRSGYLEYAPQNVGKLVRIGITLSADETCKLYADGSLQAQRIIPLADSTLPYPEIIGIGSSVAENSAMFGHIRNFRIWDMALDDQQIEIAIYSD